MRKSPQPVNGHAVPPPHHGHGNNKPLFGNKVYTFTEGEQTTPPQQIRPSKLSKTTSTTTTTSNGVKVQPKPRAQSNPQPKLSNNSFTMKPNKVPPVPAMEPIFASHPTSIPSKAAFPSHSAFSKPFSKAQSKPDPSTKQLHSFKNRKQKTEGMSWTTTNIDANDNPMGTFISTQDEGTSNAVRIQQPNGNTSSSQWGEFTSYDPNPNPKPNPFGSNSNSNTNSRTNTNGLNGDNIPPSISSQDWTQPTSTTTFQPPQNPNQIHNPFQLDQSQQKQSHKDTESELSDEAKTAKRKQRFANMKVPDTSTTSSKSSIFPIKSTNSTSFPSTNQMGNTNRNTNSNTISNPKSHSNSLQIDHQSNGLRSKSLRGDSPSDEQPGCFIMSSADDIKYRLFNSSSGSGNQFEIINGAPTRYSLIKKYAKSNAGQENPMSNVRPGSVLRLTMHYLMNYVLNLNGNLNSNLNGNLNSNLDPIPFSSKYTFLEDRIRAICKDIWVQRLHLKDRKTSIELLETTVRFRVFSDLLVGHMDQGVVHQVKPEGGKSPFPPSTQYMSQSLGLDMNIVTEDGRPDGKEIMSYSTHSNWEHLPNIFSVLCGLYKLRDLKQLSQWQIEDQMEIYCVAAYYKLVDGAQKYAANKQTNYQQDAMEMLCNIEVPPKVRRHYRVKIARKMIGAYSNLNRALFFKLYHTKLTVMERAALYPILDLFRLLCISHIPRQGYLQNGRYRWDDFVQQFGFYAQSGPVNGQMASKDAMDFVQWYSQHEVSNQKMQQIMREGLEMNEFNGLRTRLDGYRRFPAKDQFLIDVDQQSMQMILQKAYFVEIPTAEFRRIWERFDNESDITVVDRAVDEVIQKYTKPLDPVKRSVTQSVARSVKKRENTKISWNPKEENDDDPNTSNRNGNGQGNALWSQPAANAFSQSSQQSAAPANPFSQPTNAFSQSSVQSASPWAAATVASQPIEEAKVAQHEASDVIISRTSGTLQVCVWSLRSAGDGFGAAVYNEMRLWMKEIIRSIQFIKGFQILSPSLQPSPCNKLTFSSPLSFFVCICLQSLSMILSLSFCLSLCLALCECFENYGFAMRGRVTIPFVTKNG